MSKFTELDTLLREQPHGNAPYPTDVYAYARSMAAIENVVAVVSDLRHRSSRIFCGGFADVLGITDYSEEDSIWETRILSLMSDAERESKFIAELRFFHYLRRHGKNQHNYYLMTKLRFNVKENKVIDVLHRMYYIIDPTSGAITHAICLYGPLAVDFAGKSIVVNSVTGLCEELSSSSDSNILSSRERQVLGLIDTGMKSLDIATRLNISIHTVNRHRQEILSKMQVKNSIEACRRANSMSII